MFEFGLGRVSRRGAISLASRLLPPFDTNVILTNGRDEDGFPLAYVLPGGVHPDTYIEISLPAGTPHFPFGFSVEPDDHT